MPVTYVNVHAQINNLTLQNLMAAIAAKLAHYGILFSVVYARRGSDERSNALQFLAGNSAKVTMHNIGNVDSIGNGAKGK